MCYFAMVTQQDFTAISSIATIAAFVTIVTLGRMQKGKKRIVITDYRRGVRFVNGAVVEILQPGSYRLNQSKEQVTIVDMRPQPVLVERLTLQDAVRTPVVISAACELGVSDPQLACTALRDQIKDSYCIFRDTLRVTASQQILQGGAENRQMLVKAVNSAVNEELRKVGMLASDFEITEFWVGTPITPILATSGVLQ